VLADPDALDRILKNLISNAIKYSAPGTEVRLRAAARGAMVELVVEDHGRGMAPDTLARIFEPYYRAPDAPAARGTGLGLAVVKSLVDAQGGAIHVDSAPGVGTRIVVRLPAVP
jgi:two-component system sensor histidine kinase KdpD